MHRGAQRGCRVQGSPGQQELFGGGGATDGMFWGCMQARGPTPGGEGQKGPVGARPCMATAPLGTKSHPPSPRPLRAHPCPTARGAASPRPLQGPRVLRGASPLRCGVGRSVAVRGGRRQRVRGGCGVQPALGAPSTGGRRGCGPASKQDTWGAREIGLGTSTARGFNSRCPRCLPRLRTATRPLVPLYSPLEWPGTLWLVVSRTAEP